MTVCSSESLAACEPLAATASPADRWLLVELRSAWPREPLEGGLPAPVREGVREQLAALGSAKLLYLRRPGRRRGPFRVFLADSTAPSLRALEVARHEELLQLDLGGRPGEPVAGHLVLVCAHGRRDPCCARFGPPVYEELRRSALADAVWQSSHLGGHRFAANAVLLPEGLTYGRLRPATVAGLLERLGRREILLEHYRGRATYPPAAQAAERALRGREGLLGLDDLRLEAVEPDGETTRVRFRLPDGTERALDVEESQGPRVPPSCGEEPEPTRRYLVRGYKPA